MALIVIGCAGLAAWLYRNTYDRKIQRRRLREENARTRRALAAKADE